MSGLTKQILQPALGLLLFLGSAGCATYTAPKGWLPMPEDAGKFLHGAWLDVEFATSQQAVQSQQQGEFIAYGDSAIYLAGSRGITRIPISLITRVQMEVHDYSLSPYTLWTTLGALSTGSHGWFLAVTLPMWVTTGILSGVSVSKGGQERAINPDAAWWQARSMYARFPQGLPRDLPLKNLRAKP